MMVSRFFSYSYLLIAFTLAASVHARPPSGEVDDLDRPPEPVSRPDRTTTEYTTDGSLVAGGITLLGIFWASSVVAAAVQSEGEEAAGIDGDGIDAEDWYALYVPVAGPFVTAVNVRARGAGLGLLLADGILQTAGLGMLVGGFFVPRERIAQEAVRVDVGPGTVFVRGRF
ncbi:MAG: hypothetical protein AAGA56_12070 [Myxococcota bacterium]